MVRKKGSEQNVRLKIVFLLRNHHTHKKNQFAIVGVCGISFDTLLIELNEADGKQIEPEKETYIFYTKDHDESGASIFFSSVVYLKRKGKKEKKTTF